MSGQWVCLWVVRCGSHADNLTFRECRCIINT
nr:MAG TPA: hypothetical protein [Caudoviricetes sp.]